MLLKAVLITSVLALISCTSTPPAPIEIPCINNPEPKGKAFLLESFEEGNFWQAVKDSWDKWETHNLSLKAEISKDWATKGKASGLWKFDAMPKESSMQSSFTCESLLKNDWTPYNEIVIDFNNISEDPLQVNVAVQDSLEWKWTATQPLLLGKGENKNVRFSLVEGLESDGLPVEALSHADKIQCLMIQVLGENMGGQIMVDNIRLIKTDDPLPSASSEPEADPKSKTKSK